MQPAVGWWWTAADERDGASGRSSLGGHPAAVGNGRGESKHGCGIKVRLGVRAAEGTFVLTVVVGVRVGVRVDVDVPQL